MTGRDTSRSRSHECDGERKSSDRSMSRRSMIDTSNIEKAISSLRQKMKLVKPFGPAESTPEALDTNFIIVRERVQMRKQTKVVRRVRLRGHKYKVGWVVDADLERCMICVKLFGWLKGRPRHHCRACGALVCYQCSPYEADIPHIEEGRSRVCKNCFGLKPGLVDNYVVRADSESESEPVPAALPTTTFMPFRSPTVVRNHYAFRGDSVLEGSPTDDEVITSQDSTVESTHSHS